MNVFDLLKKSITLKDTSDRHSKAPGKSVKMLSHTQSIPEKKHVRADTQTHMDIHYELGKSESADQETELIKKNKEKPEAKERHKFKAAKWTHPNGHPRCIICGDEERIGGICNSESLNKSDELEKAEKPPSKHGERHPTKPYIGQWHGPKKVLSWYYNPETSKQYDTEIAAKKDAYIKTHKPEHQELVSKFINHVSSNFRRHAVPKSDEPGGLDIPRARHIRGLLNGDPNYSLQVHNPGQLSLTAHERHGNQVESSLFHFPPKDVKKSTDMSMGDQHGTQAQRLGSGNEKAQKLNALLQKYGKEKRLLGHDSKGVRGPSEPLQAGGHSGVERGSKGSTPAPSDKVLKELAKSIYDKKFLRKSYSYNEITAPSLLAKSEGKQVAAIAVLNGNKILMAKRSDNGRYTNPGGHLEPGESPVEGAKRELFEEAGIDAPSKDFKYLGSESVTTHTGKKKIIHAFVIHGNFKTNTKHDPDHEVAAWQYIDFTNGLPKEVMNNLHSPKNVLLQKLKLQ